MRHCARGALDSAKRFTSKSNRKSSTSFGQHSLWFWLHWSPSGCEARRSKASRLASRAGTGEVGHRCKSEARKSEAVPEAHRNNRIELEQRHAVSRPRLLGADVALHRGIGRDTPAVDARRVANIAHQVQIGFRRSLENHANLDWNAEVTVAARDQVAPPHRRHRRNPVEINFPISRNRCTGVTVVGCSAEREALTAGYSGGRRDGGADVGEQPRAHMKPSIEWKNIEVSFHRFEFQLTVVGNAVLGKAAAIAEIIEPGAHIGAMGYARCNFHASAQK